MARANIFAVAIAALAATLVTLASLPTADAESTLPSGFDETVVLSGLDKPTNVEFSADGRVFVAEKSGLIKAYDDLSDKQPTIFADLRTKVHNYWDRGLLGLSLDPGFPDKPYVYALYTHDAAIHETAPRWGAPGATSDPCPTPPGPTADGCVVSGHLSRLTANTATNTMTGSEKVLIEDWCQQSPATPWEIWPSATTASCTSAGATAPRISVPTTVRAAAACKTVLPRGTPVVTRLVG